MTSSISLYPSISALLPPAVPSAAATRFSTVLLNDIRAAAAANSTVSSDASPSSIVSLGTSNASTDALTYNASGFLNTLGNTLALIEQNNDTIGLLDLIDSNDCNCGFNTNDPLANLIDLIGVDSTFIPPFITLPVLPSTNPITTTATLDAQLAQLLASLSVTTNPANASLV